MGNLVNFIFQNKAFSLTVINLFLALGIFFQKDPFGFFQKTYDTAPKFFSIKQEEISKLTLMRVETPDSLNTFTKDSGKWKLEVKGKNFLVDEDKFNSFLKALLEARKFTVITEDESKHQEFGTKGQETFVVEVFVGDNSRGKLFIGNLASGGFTYVRWNEGKEVYLVEENLKSPMGRGALDYFINKKMTEKTFNSEEVASIQVTNISEEKKSYLIVKRADNWEAEKPNNLKLKKDEVTGLTRSLSSLSADEVLFEDLPKDLNRQESYELVYSFQSKDKGGESVFLKILGKDKSDNYYFQKNNEPTIYKVSSYSLKSILEFDVKKAKQE